LRFFAKHLIFSCAFIGATALFISSSPAHAAAASSSLPVKVQINDEIVDFPEVQPFIDDKGVLLVPLRALSDKLGYRVGWAKQGDDLVVSMIKNQQQVLLKSDESQALVNNKKISLESSPTVHEGNTYVPLRFITETFGAAIEWNEANQIAIVDADGKSHKPAWIAPPPPPPAPPVPSAPPMTEQIVTTANAYLGVPYAWGGTTPNGFDCSGFVRYVFQAKGIELPRTSGEMHDEGTAVSDLKTGDLVFFANRTIDHVGIYLGNGQFISSTSSRGVAVESLYSAYWSARYVGAKRVL